MATLIQAGFWCKILGEMENFNKSATVWAPQAVAVMLRFETICAFVHHLICFILKGWCRNYCRSCVNYLSKTWLWMLQLLHACIFYSLYISGDCSTVQCGYGATCKVIAGVAKCECDFTCTDRKSLVCGSDLQTYDNECKMREAGCIAKRNIIVLVNGKCG
jgi:hypothetical protein